MIEAGKEPGGLTDEPGKISPSAPFFTPAKQPDRSAPEDDHPCLRYKVECFHTLLIQIEENGPGRPGPVGVIIFVI